MTTSSGHLEGLRDVDIASIVHFQDELLPDPRETPRRFRGDRCAVFFSVACQEVRVSLIDSDGSRTRAFDNTGLTRVQYTSNRKELRDTGNTSSHFSFYLKSTFLATVSFARDIAKDTPIHASNTTCIKFREAGEAAVRRMNACVHSLWRRQGSRGCYLGAHHGAIFGWMLPWSSSPRQ